MESDFPTPNSWRGLCELGDGIGLLCAKLGIMWRYSHESEQGDATSINKHKLWIYFYFL